MGKWKVLYRKRPAWLTGEDERNRDERVRLSAFAPLAPDEAHYPGDYAGFVVSVIPADRAFSPADLADTNRAVIVLELTDEEARDLRSGRSRIVDGRQVPVTFEQRHGAISAELKRRFPLDFLVREREEEEARIATDERNRQADVSWRESLAEALALGAILETPMPVPEMPPEPEFALTASRLAKLLPRTTVHSGAGLYEVGPGKTYSTIQSALDQLWTDQGSAAFTAKQTIRVYADTYDETPTPNASLSPDDEHGYTLLLEGDPDDSRENMVVSPSSGHAVSVSIPIEIRRLKIVSQNQSAITSQYSTLYLTIHDCILETYCGSSAYHVVYGYAHTRITDCVLTAHNTCNGAFLVYGFDMRRCRITGNGSAGTFAVYGAAYSGINVEATVMSGFETGISLASGTGTYSRGYPLRAVNCTFYNCKYGIDLNAGLRVALIALNCIFKDVDYPYHVREQWPIDSATARGSEVLQRYNCYHGYTAFATDGTNTKTYAEFAAMNLVDASGDLDATDPLFTDPAAGDFSLQSTSPCWDTGHGSGVTTDYLGTALDPAHPPIGAWSPGALVKTPPTFTVGSVTDTLTVTLAGSSHRYRVRLETDAGVEEAESSRAGAGDVVFNTVAVGFHKITAWAVTADDVAALSEPSVAERVWSPGTLVVTPPGISASVSGQTVTVTLTGSAYRYRVRLETEAGVQETEVSRLGAGDIVFGSVAYGSHIVTAWSVDENDLALGEHSTTTADVLVIPDATQSFEAIANKIRGRFKTEVADDIPWGENLSKTTVSASATDNSYNDATEDLSVFVEGQQVLVSGFTESANNGYFTVVSATANKLVVSGGTLVTEAAGDSVTIKSSLPTQYDNDGSFERPTQAPWCRFTVLQGDTAQVTAGGSKRFRQPGVAVAQVFVPLSEGDARALQIADAVKLAFRSVTAAGVIYRSPSVENLGRREGEWQVNVTCPFFADDVV